MGRSSGTKSKSSPPGVIVLGGHVQALGIVRILGRKGYSVLIIDPFRFCIARFSKYSNGFKQLEVESVLDFLYNMREGNKFKNWLIMPTNDSHVRLLSENKPKLEDHYIVGTDDWESVQKVYNKKLTYKIAEKLNLKYPKTWYPENESDIESGDYIFPCILKPSVMHSFYSVFKTKVIKCYSRTDLLESYRKITDRASGTEMMIQEIIPGDSESQYSVCYLFDEKSKLKLVAQRSRQHPIEFGNATTFAYTVEDMGLGKNSEMFLKEIGYKGICEVEYKRSSKDKQFYLLEVNPRTWKWHTISEPAGVPFLTEYIKLLNGAEVEMVKSHRNAAFIHRTTDIPVRISMFFKGKRIKTGYRGSKQYAVWDARDILPSVVELLTLPINIFRR